METEPINAYGITQTITVLHPILNFPLQGINVPMHLLKPEKSVFYSKEQQSGIKFL